MYIFTLRCMGASQFFCSFAVKQLLLPTMTKPFQNGVCSWRKNLLHKEQILSFKNWPQSGRRPQLGKMKMAELLPLKVCPFTLEVRLWLYVSFQLLTSLGGLLKTAVFQSSSQPADIINLFPSKWIENLRSWCMKTQVKSVIKNYPSVYLCLLLDVLLMGGRW